VWSVGCIFAELILNKILLPASNEQELIVMITRLCGNASESFVSSIEDTENQYFLRNLERC
jgi:hypothetical protein